MKQSLKLAREIFEVGLASKEKYQGYKNERSWKSLDDGNIAAWTAIDEYLKRNFVRRKRVSK